MNGVTFEETGAKSATGFDFVGGERWKRRILKPMNGMTFEETGAKSATGFDFVGGERWKRQTGY